MIISNAELYRLKSDARRGLLENDLILERFFGRYGDHLDVPESKILGFLLALDDNDLMDLLIGRKDFLPGLVDDSQLEALEAILQKLREK
mgnify:CR=1 FL=1